MNRFKMLKGKIARLPLTVKQWGLFAAWIGGLVLVGILLWGLTGSLRSQLIAMSVNKVLDRSGIPHRLDRATGALGKPGRAMQLGSWFTLKNAGGRAVVFPLMSGPNTAAAMALLSPEGKVESLVPLSTGAVQVFERLPAGVAELYIRRAEEACALLGALPEEEAR
ncbi:MAG: hypothetical protein LBP80_08480 [Treponema sp.]|jgi:hypothetical protein|nr:hypothetical protein [Treponema sp.]